MSEEMDLGTTVNDLIIDSLAQVFPSGSLLAQIKQRFKDLQDGHCEEKLPLPEYQPGGDVMPSDRAALDLHLHGNFPAKGISIDSLFLWAVGEPVLNAQKRLRKGYVTLPSGQQRPSGYYHGSISIMARMKTIDAAELAELVVQESNLDLQVGPKTYLVIDIVNTDPFEQMGFSDEAYEKIRQKYEDLKALDNYSSQLQETEAALAVEADPDRVHQLEAWYGILEARIKKLTPRVYGDGKIVKGSAGVGIAGTIKYVKLAGGFVKYSNARDDKWCDGSKKNGLAPGEERWWKKFDGAHVRVYIPESALVDLDSIVERKTQRYPRLRNTEQIMRDAIEPIPVNPYDGIVFDDVSDGIIWDDD